MGKKSKHIKKEVSFKDKIRIETLFKLYGETIQQQVIAELGVDDANHRKITNVGDPKELQTQLVKLEEVRNIAESNIRRLEAKIKEMGGTI